MSIDYKAEINRLKQELDVTVVAHYYQRDEVFEMADIVGDSLELARRSKADTNPWVVFCGVVPLPMHSRSSKKVWRAERRSFLFLTDV